MMRYRIFFMALLVHLSAESIGQGQSGYPEIKKRFPDFMLQPVSNFSRKQITLNDFAGKHLIIFFWSKYCSACIESLPAAAYLQNKFGDKVTILIVGDEEPDGSVSSLYLRAKKKLNLPMPYVFDKVFFARNVPRATPHLIWIDGEGIVQAITASAELNESNVTKFVNGIPFEFIDRSEQSSYSSPTVARIYDQPFFTNGNLGEDTDFMFRSILSKATPEMPFIALPPSVDGFFKIETYPKGLVQGCASIRQLYRFAYTGYSSWSFGHELYGVFDPVLELRVNDTSYFETDFTTKKGFYCYSLSVPPERATRKEILAVMQRDLTSYFGYQVMIEKMLRPVWKIYADRKAEKRLKTKNGDTSQDTFDWLHVRATNISMKTMIERVFAKHLIDKQPIVDSTNIDFNIDIDIRANLLDLEDIRRELEKIGLILTQETEELNVIVITDPVN